MKTQRYGYHLFALIAVVTIIVACGPSSRQRVAATLDDVETYINDRPDSALAVLRSLDTTALRTPALRARYSLLHVMALYKNYEDVTRPGLLDDAVRYYDRHGTADEKMKTLYYQGCIAQANNDQKNAAVLYAKAEEYAGKVTDKHALGLLYVAESSVYNNAYNTDKEKEYVEKALEVFQSSNDPMYGSVLGDLAMVYHTREEWEKADSLYHESIIHSASYPIALPLYLSNYARMKVQQPDKDPEGTIALLDRKRGLTGNLTPQEAGAYAYALALMGEVSASESLRSRLDTLSGRARYDVLPWLRRMAVYCGDYSLAYSYQAEARDVEYELIKEALSDSSTQALQDHYEYSAQQEKGKKLRLGVSALIVILGLLLLAIALLLQERHLRAERDRLVLIRASLEEDLRKREDSVETYSPDLSSKLERLRMELQQERLERLRRRGYYGYWLWMEQNRRSSDKEIIRSLRKDLQEICALEKDHRALECRLDQDLDGLVSRLKDDLRLKGKLDDERFLCYWLIGLKADMIAELMGISTNYVYVKTSRLENRIRHLGKPEYSALLKK